MDKECKHTELLIKHEIICRDCGEKGSGTVDLYQNLIVCWETRAEVIGRYIQMFPMALDVPVMRAVKSNIEQQLKELKFTISCQQLSTVGNQRIDV